jgi:hypothetical protein
MIPVVPIIVVENRLLLIGNMIAILYLFSEDANKYFLMWLKLNILMRKYTYIEGAAG